MDGHDGSSGRDVLFQKQLHNRIALCGSRALESHHVGLVVVTAVCRYKGRFEPREGLKRPVIARGEIAATLKEIRQTFELDSTDSRLHVRHAKVIAYFFIRFSDDLLCAMADNIG